jgi:hypothetical protein
MEDEIRELRNVIQTLEQELSNERDKSRILETKIIEVWIVFSGKLLTLDKSSSDQPDFIAFQNQKQELEDRLLQ